jgi:Protein of unknown function (DUF3168)
MNPGLALQQAMQQALIANTTLTTLLGGQRIYDELPRGEPAPYVAFEDLETRDWSVKDQKAHEHFVTIFAATNDRRRVMAQAIVSEVETSLDNAALLLNTHRLINLRVVFWNVSRRKSDSNFSATIRLRAATEPL